MATNGEKFVSMLKDIAGGNEGTYENLKKKAVESGITNLNSMSDEEYMATVQNFAAGPLRETIKGAFSKIDPNKNEKSWQYVTGVSQRAAKYEKKNFDRDQATLEKYYGDRFKTLSEGTDENELKYQAAMQGTTPDILRAEIRNAQSKVAEDKKKEDDYRQEKKAATEKANADAQEYRSGIKGALYSENSKRDFEEGNTAKGVVSNILTKGATVADVASGFMGPTPWGFGVAAAGPLLRFVDNHVIHTSDDDYLTTLGKTAADLTMSMGTQFLSPLKSFGIGKGAFESVAGSHMGDAFLTGAEEAIKNASSKQSVKAAEKALAGAEKAYKRAAEMKAAAIKRGSKFTKEEKAATKEYEAAQKANLNAAKDAVKSAKSGEALASVMKKTGNTSTAKLVVGKGLVAAGKASMRTTTGQNASSENKTKFERQAEEFNVTPVTIRMWNNGFKPHGGEELEIYKQWEEKYRGK